MNRELTGDEVYKNLDEITVTKNNYKCKALLNITFEPSVHTISELEFDDLNLEIGSINCRTEIQEEVYAFNVGQPSEIWANKVNEKKQEIKKKLNEHGISATIAPIQDSMSIIEI